MLNAFNELSSVLDQFHEGNKIEAAASILSDSLKQGNKILTCGNGGSAADAQHFACELVGRFLHQRQALPAISLTTDTSILTAIANDMGFVNVFSRQIEALGQSGDVLIAFSTSGHSENILSAIHTAQKQLMKVIVMTGEQTNPILESCDVHISVPSKSTPRIQEIHTLILHILCEQIEKEMTSWTKQSE